MSSLKITTLIGITALSLGLSACQKETTSKASTDTKKETDVEVKSLQIGFQKSSLNFLVAREQKLFEQQFPNTKIEWREFPAGPQMLEALAVGAVDFGYVGNTPPIFAQAADKNLSYAGYEVYPEKSLGLVLPNNSSIRSLSDLKGKRIALQKGSSAHEFLAKVLQKANLSWQDIQPIWLPPADARAAFNKGSVDAWAIWDPFLSAIELSGPVTTFISGSDFPTTYSYYISNPTFVNAHPGVTDKVLKSLNDADSWILNNQDLAVDLYASSTGLKKDIAKNALDRRSKPSPIRPITSLNIESQQQIADLFYKEKLIPKQIKIQDAILNSESNR